MATHDPIQNLIELLAHLPGVGERTAARLAFYILEDDDTYAKALGASLATIHELILSCETCGNYDAVSPCTMCKDPRRDETVLCVVAKVPDLLALERLGSFRGHYHVLHKLLAPLDGIGPSDLPLDKLVARIQVGKIREVIIATPLSVEGEATALYTGQVLAPTGIKVSRIASGVPHGGELEFTDQVTLGRALEDRRSL